MTAGLWWCLGPTSSHQLKLINENINNKNVGKVGPPLTKLSGSTQALNNGPNFYKKKHVGLCDFFLQ